MVKVVGPLFSLEARGTLKQTLTYQMRYRGGSCYPYPYVPDPRTPSQQSVRAELTRLVHSWQELPEASKDVYRQRAIGRYMSGYNLYVHDNWSL